MKRIVGIFIGLCACIFFARAAFACDAGYYLDDNNQCAACNTSAAYYCPGDDTKHDCPTIDDNFYQWAYDTYGITKIVLGTRYWTSGSTYKASPTDCVAYAPMQNDSASQIYFSVRYSLTKASYTGSAGVALYYSVARSGYYLKNRVDSSAYYNIAACTNAPAHAHYTGAGTPDVGNCPWVCDSGYGQTDDGQCLELCGAGVTKLHVGNLAFNVYANKHTTPALHIKYNNTICYVSVASGTDTNTLHFQYQDTTYHTIN